MGGGQHGGPRLEDCRGLASVHDGRCQKSDAPVAVLLVVPAKEPAAEVESVVVAGEAVWEVGPVLQRLELALGEGVVVTDVRSAVGLGHAKGGQELRHGLGSHGCPAVAVDRQLITADALLDERLANQSFGEMLGFPAGQHPSHDVPAVDVEDDVEVVVGPLRRSEQLRDVPRPDLIGSRGHQLRFGIRGMSELSLAPDQLLRPGQRFFWGSETPTVGLSVATLGRQACRDTPQKCVTLKSRGGCNTADPTRLGKERYW